MQERQAYCTAAINRSVITGCHRMRRYIRKVPALRWMPQLEFAPVFDIHQSPLALGLFTFVTLVSSWPNQRNIAAALSNPACPFKARVLQLCNSLVWLLVLPPFCCCRYRVFTLVRCATPASWTHLPGHDRTDRQSAHAHWRLGELGSRNALQLLQHELGAGKGRDKNTETASSCSSGPAPVQLFCAAAASAVSDLREPSLDHEMGLVSALCCKTGCTQCPRGYVFCTVLECKQRASSVQLSL